MAGISTQSKVLSDTITGDTRRPRPVWLDCVLLPMIALFTIGLLESSMEHVARQMFQTSASTTLSCLVLNDSSTGVGSILNSVCSQRARESRLVEYRFHRCGYRTEMDCDGKSAGAYRIVMIGSSFNFGMFMPRDQSFAALLPEELSNESGRKVELYN